MNQSHMMGLFAQYFDMMASGEKKIEIRLNDSKRQKLSVGDIIVFEKLPERFENLAMEITALDRYSNFADLIYDTPLAWGGPHWKSKDDLIAAGSNYPKEDIEKYGFLRIGVKPA